MTTLSCAVGLLALTLACQKNEEPLLDSAGVPLSRRADAAAGTDTPQARSAADQALIRNYGPTEMKLHACATLESDGAVRGNLCPSSFVLFGPYVATPAYSDVHVRFEVHSHDRIVVSGDIMSDSARRFHGSFGDHIVDSDAPASIDIKVNVPLPTQGMEARVFIRAAEAASFEIKNLTIGVE